MKPMIAAEALAGFAIALIGLLWLLQGAGAARICPILCFADCGCVEGGSVEWEAAGIAALGIGITMIWLGIAGGSRKR